MNTPWLMSDFYILLIIYYLFFYNYPFDINQLLYGTIYTRKCVSIPPYLIKFVSDLQQVGVFFSGTPVSSINKTDSHDINEIL
jgi:hypothetical protein